MQIIQIRTQLKYDLGIDWLDIRNKIVRNIQLEHHNDISNHRKLFCPTSLLPSVTICKIKIQLTPLAYLVDFINKSTNSDMFSVAKGHLLIILIN